MLFIGSATMTPYQVSVLVKCKGIYDYIVKTGSLELYVDPLYKQGAHKVTSGTVVEIPMHTPDWLRIVPELKSGDKIYFHYNSLDEDALVPETDGIFSILYDMIFCYVRDGEIVPIAGKCLCKPYFDPDITEIEIGGQMVKCKMTKSGIIKEINVRHSLKRAILTHIGTQLVGETKPDVKVGDIVYYAINADFENVIEGDTYFVMDQEVLLMTEEATN